MSIKITGLKEIQAKLSKLSSLIDGKEMEQKMENIGRRVKKKIIKSFEDEKSPFGEPWKPLKQSTKKLKAKRGKIDKILQQDGDLKGNDKGVTWHVHSTPNKVTVSNNVTNKGFHYGLTHQFGTSNAWGRGIKVPARPFLPVDDNGVFEQSLKDDILDFLSDEFDRVLN